MSTIPLKNLIRIVILNCDYTFNTWLISEVKCYAFAFYLFLLLLKVI